MPVTSENVCREKLDHAVQALIMVLSSRDGMLRKSARESLVAIGTPAVPALMRAIAEADKTARWEATKALGSIGDPAAAPALVQVLDDDDFGVRWLASDALIGLGVHGLEPLLIALLHNPDSGRLREAAHHVVRVLCSRGGTLGRQLTALEDALGAMIGANIVSQIQAALQALGVKDNAPEPESGI